MNIQIKKRILLITSSTESCVIGTVNKEHKEGANINDDESHYPLGLAYLHSAVENAGHDVRTLFLNNHDDEYCDNNIKETLKNFLPDIVGFQILTQNRVSSYRAIQYIRDKYPHINQVIGGIHATIMHEQIIKKYPYVIAILGEGEITLPELIKELSNDTPNLQSVDGIAFFENNTIVKTKQRQLISNLDEIPFPKHEIFFNGKRRAGSIMTTRGCPFNCSFCCLDSVSRRRVRSRSIGNIIEEIEWMRQKFPQMTDIWIHDDSFFIDNQRVIEFCNEIIKRKIKINFVCNGRLKPISEEMVYKLEQANFSRILFGLESGDNDILQKCHKGINQEDVVTAYKLFAKTKINIFSHIIVGLPGENIKTVMTTAKFIKKLQRIKCIPNYNAYLLTIFPGTEVYEMAKTAGIINDDYWLTDGLAPVFTAENSFEKLTKFQDILLNNISPIRTFTTIAGFKSQFFLIPYHIKYILSSKSTFKNFIFSYINFILPVWTYKYKRKIYSFIKNI